MLDNMDIETTKEAIKIINKKAIIECSGNVDINNIIVLKDWKLTIFQVEP